jgi:hypothetical protein
MERCCSGVDGINRTTRTRVRVEVIDHRIFSGMPTLSILVGNPIDSSLRRESIELIGVDEVVMDEAV